MEGPIGGYAGATPRASRSAEREKPEKEKPEKEKQNLPLLSLFSNYPRKNQHAGKIRRPRRPAEPVAGDRCARPVRFSFAISVSLPGFV